MCSMLNAYVMVRVLQEAERGEFDLQQAIFLDPALLIPHFSGDGITGR
nr:hypothetical protein [Mycobacterium uberis]